MLDKLKKTFDNLGFFFTESFNRSGISDMRKEIMDISDVPTAFDDKKNLRDDIKKVLPAVYPTINR